MSSRPYDLSARVTFERGCEGKQRYITRKEAKKVRARTKSSEHLAIYRCGFCEFFHLGHLARAVVRGDLSRAEYRGEI